MVLTCLASSSTTMRRRTAIHLISVRSHDGATHCEPAQAVILCSVIPMEQGRRPARSPMGPALE